MSQYSPTVALQQKSWCMMLCWYFAKKTVRAYYTRTFNSSDLITAVRDLFWYISPHHVKFALHGATLPTFIKPLIAFNNSEGYKSKPGNIRSKKIFKLVGIVTNLLEKSSTSRKTFDSLKQQFDYLIESCIKYTD